MFEDIIKINTSSDMLKYVGMLVVIIFIIYLIVRMANIQMGVIEGLTNKKDTENSVASLSTNLDKQIENLTDEISYLKESMLFDKYKEKYEDLIIKYDEYIDLSIIKQGTNVSKLLNGNDKDLEQLNRLIQTKENLNKVMEILDEQK